MPTADVESRKCKASGAKKHAPDAEYSWYVEEPATNILEIASLPLLSTSVNLFVLEVLFQVRIFLVLGIRVLRLPVAPEILLLRLGGIVDMFLCVVSWNLQLPLSGNWGSWPDFQCHGVDGPSLRALSH